MKPKTLIRALAGIVIMILISYLAIRANLKIWWIILSVSGAVDIFNTAWKALEGDR